MLVLLAQQPTGLGGPIGGEGLGPFGAITAWTKGKIGERLGGGISAIIGFLTIVAGLYFIFQFIIGALAWLSSGGDKNALSTAQQKLSNALIGLTLVVAAVAIVKLVGIFLGLNILNPAAFIDLIKLPGGGP